MIYTYPCLFHKEKDDSYTGTFIDLASGFISAENKDDAIESAVDTLFDILDDEEDFPKNLLPQPTKIEDIELLKYNNLYFNDDNMENISVENISVED